MPGDQRAPDDSCTMSQIHGRSNNPKHRFLLKRFSGAGDPDWWRKLSHYSSGGSSWRNSLRQPYTSNSVPPVTFSKCGGHYRSTDTFNEPDPLSTPTRYNHLPKDMDFSKFRDTGELSDIAVLVDGQEFHLHKFPLYIKSDFFRALARSTRQDAEPVVLDEFPGGVETFAQIVNYFYNVKIDVNKVNVCSLRCAAEFLQMCSSGNLASLTDRYLQDILTTAKLGHKVSTIIDLVLQCADLGPIAEQAKIIDKCLLAMVECWIIACKFDRQRLTSECKSLMADSIMRETCKIPLSWYTQLFVLARDKNVHPQVLGKLAQTYITDAAERQQGMAVVSNLEDTPSEEQPAETQDIPDEAEAHVTSHDEGDDDRSGSTDSNSGNDSSSVDSQRVDQREESPAQDRESPDQDRESLVQDGESPAQDRESLAQNYHEEEAAPQQSEEKESQPKVTTESDLDLGQVMDAIMLEVPIETAAVVEAFSRKWVAAMLQIAETLGCKSREILLKLLGRMLHRMNKEDLMDLTPETLSEIIKEGCQSSQADPNDVCRVLDDYLSSQAEKKHLTVDMFMKLVDSVPKDSRINHDTLFAVLESILKSDNGDMDESSKQELLETVDFSRLSETTLQNALDSNLVPVGHIAQASLALCSKLRTDLDTAHRVIQTQEQLIERLGEERTAVTSSWTSPLHSDTDNLYERSYPRIRPLGGATPTLASDLELKMALDSLDRSMDRTSRRSRSMTGTGPIPDSLSDYYTNDRDDVNRHVSPKPYLSTYSLSKWYQGHHHH